MSSMLPSLYKSLPMTCQSSWWRDLRMGSKGLREMEGGDAMSGRRGQDLSWFWCSSYQQVSSSSPSSAIGTLFSSSSSMLEHQETLRGSDCSMVIHSMLLLCE